MTPEERFIKIENTLRTISESLAQQHVQTERQNAQIEKQNAQIEKHNAAIRDLIEVSRTVLTSIQEMGARHDRDHERVMGEIDKLREAQTSTDEKLNILVDTVDRIIRRRNGKDLG